MSNIENIRLLANVALDSGSHEDLYKYGSAILEIDAQDGDAWLYKAIGAALNTDDTEKRVKEAKTLATQALSKELDIKISQIAGRSFFDAYRIQIQHLNDALLGKIKDHQKVAMPDGGSALVHGFAQSLNKVLAAQNQAAARTACLELTLIACRLDPRRENFDRAVKLTEELKEHAKNNGNYLKEHVHETSIWRINREILILAKSSIEGYVEPSISPANNSNSGGCFIATAAVGDYDHPKVIYLRQFRDNVLQKNLVGKIFVRFYYLISPTFARQIAKSRLTRLMVVKFFIDPIILLIEIFTKRN